MKIFLTCFFVITFLLIFLFFFHLHCKLFSFMCHTMFHDFCRFCLELFFFYILNLFLFGFVLSCVALKLFTLMSFVYIGFHCGAGVIIAPWLALLRGNVDGQVVVLLLEYCLCICTFGCFFHQAVIIAVSHHRTPCHLPSNCSQSPSPAPSPFRSNMNILRFFLFGTISILVEYQLCLHKMQLADIQISSSKVPRIWWSLWGVSSL